MEIIFAFATPQRRAERWPTSEVTTSEQPTSKSECRSRFSGGWCCAKNLLLDEDVEPCALPISLLLLCPPRHVCTGRMPRPFSVCGGGLALCDLVYAYTLLTTPSYLAANERTFLHWMSTSVTIGSIAAALSGKFRAAVCAPFTDTAQIMGGLRLCLACRCSRACSQTLGG